MGISLETPQVGRGKEEERSARLENNAATKRLSLAMRRKKSKTGEDVSYQTVQVGHGDAATTQLKLALETEEERRAKNGLTWIETGVFKNKTNSGKELACPVVGAIF